MATEKWVAGSGQGLTWGAAFGASVGSLGSGNAVLSTIAIANGTALDIFADFSLVSATTVNPTAPNTINVYLYPLAEDGATWGDGSLTTGSAASGIPPSQYLVGTISTKTTGASVPVVSGTLTGIVLPPGSFSFVVYNNMGVTLASTVDCKYRTYNRSIA